MGVVEAVTEQDVDVALLLQDPRAALFPMLTKVRGWEEVSAQRHRIKSSSADVSDSTIAGGQFAWACKPAASWPGGTSALRVQTTVQELLCT